MKRREKTARRRFVITSIVFLGICLLSDAVSAAVVESTWHGQFRINYYNLGQDSDNGPDVAAARLRWRPTWDAEVSKDASMHVQLNIGHINSNRSNARCDKSGRAPDGSCIDPAVALRHAMVTFTTPGIDGKIAAGIVPVSDHFGDTLFSGDWDFNPLTFVYMGKLGPVDLRLATAKLAEGSEAYSTAAGARDDLDIHLVDVDAPLGSGTVGASFYTLISQDAATGLAIGPLGGSAKEYYYGIRAAQEMGIVRLNAFLLGNSGTIKECDASFCGALAGQDVDNTGFAGKIESVVALGPAHVGLMAIYASGDKDFVADDSSSSFITPMALVDHHGYWGYTGKLNIQGPTDTGIDDPVRIDGSHYGGDGLGYGLMTVQIKADFPIVARLTGYVAAGIFQNVDVPDVPGLDEKNIGTDVYIQGKYSIAENLNLEAGVDWAALAKENPVYGFTKDNTITVGFARLQIEY